MLGAGKYDDEATLIRERTKARGVIVIVLDGNRGSGFSCQAPIDVTLKMPDLLELVARDIRESGGPFAPGFEVSGGSGFSPGSA